MEMWETQKAEIRSLIRKKLKAMPEKEKTDRDRRIAERVMKLPEIADAGAVYGYASLSWETGTGEILGKLWERKCIVCLPRVFEDTMEFFLTESAKDLAEGSFHIMEPKMECRKVKDAGLERPEWSRVLWTAPILIPGMAFTESGVRLGKGGGFYDRYLEKHTGHKTIALAYEVQILEEIPAGPYDRSVDLIVTENRVIRCRK